MASKDGSPLTCQQITKRMAYRDFISAFDYVIKRNDFEKKVGVELPHDRIAGTVVREVK